MKWSGEQSREETEIDHFKFAGNCIFVSITTHCAALWLSSECDFILNKRY